MTTDKFLKQATKRVESAILSTYKDVWQELPFVLSLEELSTGTWKATFEVHCFCVHQHYVTKAYVVYNESDNSWSIRYGWH